MQQRFKNNFEHSGNDLNRFTSFESLQQFVRMRFSEVERPDFSISFDLHMTSMHTLPYTHKSSLAINLI